MMMRTGHGGSIPEQVMRTGVILPFNPARARQDISVRHVLDATSLPTGRLPDEVELPAPLPPAPQSPVTSAVAATTTAIPPTPVAAPMAPVPQTSAYPQPHHWQKFRHHTFHGPMLGEWRGRPVATFQIASSPTAAGAHAATSALKRAAQALRQAGLGPLPPELIAGPLAALMRGGAVELHFQNGVVMRAAL